MSETVEVLQTNGNMEAKTNETVVTKSPMNGTHGDEVEVENKDEQQYLDLIEKIIKTGGY